ncbi:MAG: TIGR00730 family Rossman fold protein [Ignavibacteriales bacterium CG12_big_fil_rev_8_21_14_0_65_30_8]|nr:MAG: TIGR00730 family Rossman fold protein [Ignavibacteriales bacterium CG12_big_fil_rev_8_21_14_0_65_30_8]
MKKKDNVVKAYQNDNFLNSSDGRIVRMLSEFLEPQSRFRKQKIVDTIVFFGSARLKSKKDAATELNKFKSMDANGDPDFAEKLRVAQHHLKMSKYYEDAVQLSKKLTEWSLNLKTKANRFTICTGGGPGIMEAANKGAKLAGGKSIGLNISIPFEQFVNRFVHKSLSFEFHYFFMRKFWFAYLAKTLVVFPGGFGTMDEFFEILTLIQTGKIKKKMLLIVYNENYWRSIINFEGLIENGVINQKDMDYITFCDNVDDTFKTITKYLDSYHLVSKWKEEVEPKLHLT